ncbi:ABC transporter permease subunit [Neptunicella marina]|uniref:ABC transporter permease n=1 Tax=Neptunicella marina TaxID=2125989 RepID=A0A8J6LWZ8_9ALTE|nr:ABC transporter permease subunit [Neptunicella marina]MBC3764480.1 ABC transporter permease [Neptunicella marina]
MWQVFNKEIKELIRDKKTLFFMIALPVLLFPLIIGSMAFISGNAIKEAQNKVLKFAITGEAYAPGLYDALLAAEDKFSLVDINGSDDYAALIKAQKVDFVLVIPESFEQNLFDAGQQKLSLYLNDASLNMVYNRVNELVEDIAKNRQLQAFQQLGVTDVQQKALLEPIVLEKQDVADKRENWGEKIGGMVPYLVFLLCFQGAMYPSSDIGAGEKERGTLETLLISPIARYKLVLGKFLTIAFAGGVSALITILSMATWGVILSQGMAIKFVAEFMSAISALDFILMFLMLLPVTAIFASVLLCLSIYARSFKEAQSYMGALVIFIILPIMVAMLPGVSLDGGWAWVPITNVALAMKELIKGTMDYFALFSIFGSTVLIAGGLIAFCVYWFNQEKVLFR